MFVVFGLGSKHLDLLSLNLAKHGNVIKKISPQVPASDKGGLTESCRISFVNVIKKLIRERNFMLNYYTQLGSGLSIISGNHSLLTDMQNSLNFLPRPRWQVTKL